MERGRRCAFGLGDWIGVDGMDRSIEDTCPCDDWWPHDRNWRPFCTRKKKGTAAPRPFLQNLRTFCSKESLKVKTSLFSH